MGGWHVHGRFHLAPRQVCGTVRDKGRRTMGWKGKLALDGLVAVVVWAIGAVLFFQFMDKEDLEILFFVPGLPAVMFFMCCRDFNWPRNMVEFVWLVVPPVLWVLLMMQFTKRRSVVWTVLGAVAVGLWWACGVLVAFVLAAFPSSD